MLFDNPIFANWYTDTVSIYRASDTKVGNVTKKQRNLVAEHIPCRMYSVKKSGPSMRGTAAQSISDDKLSCDISVDIKAGDELQVIRGGGLGMKNQSERYFAGKPQKYHDPVGGALSGLEHQEIGLLMENIIN